MNFSENFKMFSPLSEGKCNMQAIMMILCVSKFL